MSRSAKIDRSFCQVFIRFWSVFCVGDTLEEKAQGTVVCVANRNYAKQIIDETCANWRIYIGPHFGELCELSLISFSFAYF